MKTLKTSLYASLLILAGLFGSTSAAASDKQGQFYGQGKISCSDFLEEQKTKSWTSSVYKGFIAGFLSGYNLAKPNTYNILGNSDINGAVLWIKNHCEKQPLEDVNEALNALAFELYPRRTQNAP